MFKNDQARSAALTAGQTRYAGRSCTHCDSSERYTSSGSCVRCSLRRAQQRAGSLPTPGFQSNVHSARGAAFAAKQKTFIGRPCATCTSTERYTSSGSCIHCAKTAHLSAPSRANEPRRETSTAVPLRPEDGLCQCCGEIAPQLIIDHDHALEELGFPASETFRGWICYACNTGIGRLGDNAAGVQRALDYLRRLSP
jgi:hypothetical protein